MATTEKKTTIRFEDLGEPVQKLLRSLSGGYTTDDMALFEFVSVKDMARIYQEMGSERGAENIWEELRGTLLSRREKAERKKKDMDERQVQLETEATAEAADAERLEAEEAAKAEARRLRKEERKRRKAEEAEAAAAEGEEDEARLAEEAEAEAAELAATEKAEKKRRKREEKKRRLAEEQEALAAEAAAAADEGKKRKKRDLKREWTDYVAQHPLEFSSAAPIEIQQVKVERTTRAPPSATASLMSRSYTPQCPNCHAKYSKAPAEWDCPMCLRKFRQRIKTWQPDTDSCGVCTGGVGRFTRHHCRNCGRVTCGKCTDAKASIPSLGFNDPVKVCRDCMAQLGSAAPTVA